MKILDELRKEFEHNFEEHKKNETYQRQFNLSVIDNSNKEKTVKERFDEIEMFLCDMTIGFTSLNLTLSIKRVGEDDFFFMFEHDKVMRSTSWKRIGALVKRLIILNQSLKGMETYYDTQKND